MIGQRFGRLVVVTEAHKTRHRHWKCMCDCGNGHVVRGSSLKNGHTQSCGCLGAERRLKAATEAKIKHGRSKTSIYNVWASMVQRCRDHNDKRWSSYGGRGITVCERWANFANFLEDMGERPTGLTLDRVDVNGNYSPDNCRWATQSQQMNNTRRNVHISYNGENFTISQWAEKIGINKGTLWNRIRKLGMSIEKALSTNDLRK